jgi:hypothetical protein
VESSSDDDFNQFADVLIDQLLVPAGAAYRHDKDSVTLWPARLVVDTPLHVDSDARFSILASVTGVEATELSGPTTPAPLPLRSVATGASETDRSFWLGRPLQELRRAVAGRRVTALHRGYLEVATEE